MKTIIEFEEEEQKKVNIQNVALDVFRRRIYWTDPTMTEGEGRIESANLDEETKESIRAQAAAAAADAVAEEIPDDTPER